YIRACPRGRGAGGGGRAQTAVLFTLRGGVDVEGDVLEFLPRIPLESLAAVRVFFPDPWPKNKQRHRRLFRPDVVTALVDRLQVGGTLHIATDIEDYARQVIEVAAGDGRLLGGVVPRPEWRPVTRYERRGLAAGRTPHDLIYERMSRDE
ncbi:MAG: hypothetical protein WCK21_10945, partial [Actinomycetota bacterium]